MSFAKRHQKDIVVCVNVVEEALNRTGCCTHFVRHAAARIEKNSDADGQIAILREVRDLLRDTVFRSVKSSAVRFATNLPSASVTVVTTLTSRTSTRRVVGV